LEKHQPDYEILVVEDGSTDRTVPIVRSLAKHNKRIKLLHHAQRLGKGGALNIGLLAAKGDPIMMVDADGSMPAAHIGRLLAGMKNADLVIGSRYTKGSHVYGRRPWARRFIAWGFREITVPLYFGIHLSDTQSGYKAMRRKLVEQIIPKMKSTWFEWDVELLVRAKRAGFKITEVSIDWRDVAKKNVHALRDSWRMGTSLLALRSSLK